MARKGPSKDNPRREQRDGAPPVIEDRNLPRMGEVEIAARRIGRKLVTMPDEPRPYRGTRNLMDPVPRGKVAGRGKTAPRELGDQLDASEPKAEGGKAMSSAGSAGYIRLRVRVDNGELTLAGARFVEGPLVEERSAHPGLSYEVKVDGRRVAFGGVPEPREWRSYPDPLGRPGLEGHHLQEQTVYEFTARVPADEISHAALSNTQVTLYDVSGDGPGEPLDITTLTKQPREKVRTIGILRGIELDGLPKGVREDMRRAIR